MKNLVTRGVVWALALGFAVLAQQTPPVAPEAGAYPCIVSRAEFGNTFTFTPTGLDLVPTATVSSSPSPLGTITLDGKGKYTVSGFKAGENAGTYAFANNAFAFKTGVLSKFKHRYYVGHSNGKVSAYHFEVAFGGASQACSKPATRAVTLTALKTVNGGLGGVLSFEGEFNTVVDFELRTGKVLERYANSKFPHRVPGNVWAYSKANPNDLSKPTLVIARDGQPLAQFKAGFMGDAVTTSGGKPGEFPRFTSSSEPVLSPDASRVAFVGTYSLRSGEGFAVSYEDKYGLMVVDRSGKLLACLDDAAYGDLPSWMPDNRLVYATGDDQLVLLDRNLQRPKRIAQPGSSRPAFSPDGGRLAYVRSKQDVWLIGADGSGAKKLFSAGLEVAHLAWAPDGRALAVLAKNGPSSGQLQIVTLNAQGGTAKVLAVTNPFNEPVYTAALRLTWWQPGAKPVAPGASTTPGSGNPASATTGGSGSSGAAPGKSSGASGSGASPWPPSLSLDRAYTVTVEGQGAWPLVFRQRDAGGLRGTAQATIDNETQEVPARWEEGTATLELVDDESRIRCVFDRVQDGVLFGTATYSDPSGANEALGSCQLNLQP